MDVEQTLSHSTYLGTHALVDPRLPTEDLWLDGVEFLPQANSNIHIELAKHKAPLVPRKGERHVEPESAPLIELVAPLIDAYPVLVDMFCEICVPLKIDSFSRGDGENKHFGGCSFLIRGVDSHGH